MNFRKHDWNGDGKIDRWDDIFELSMIIQLVEDQEREDCRRMAEAELFQSLCEEDRKDSGDTRGEDEEDSEDEPDELCDWLNWENF